MSNGPSNYLSNESIQGKEFLQQNVILGVIVFIGWLMLAHFWYQFVYRFFTERFGRIPTSWDLFWMAFFATVLFLAFVILYLKINPGSLFG